MTRQEILDLTLRRSTSGLSDKDAIAKLDSKRGKLDTDKPLVTDKDRQHIDKVRTQLARNENPFATPEPPKREKRKIEPVVDNGPDSHLEDKWQHGIGVHTHRQPRITIILKEGTPVRQDRCIHCGKDVNPGFCHRGKVLEAFSYLRRDKEILMPDGEIELKEIKVPIVSYLKGYLCDDCAADYRMAYNERTGQRLPIVTTDTVRMKRPEERVGYKSNKGFNTRITTG